MKLLSKQYKNYNNSFKYNFKSNLTKKYALNNQEQLSLTRWTRSGLDPRDFRRPPSLPPAGFGTVAEKSFSSSDTSNSGALNIEGKNISHPNKRKKDGKCVKAEK